LNRVFKPKKEEVPLAMLWITHYFRTCTGDHAFKLLKKQIVELHVIRKNPWGEELQMRTDTT
jgi:hypothetical protein